MLRPVPRQARTRRRAQNLPTTRFRGYERRRPIPAPDESSHSAAELPFPVRPRLPSAGAKPGSMLFPPHPILRDAPAGMLRQPPEDTTQKRPPGPYRAEDDERFPVSSVS